jgi:hypothetical protein
MSSKVHHVEIDADYGAEPAVCHVNFCEADGDIVIVVASYENFESAKQCGHRLAQALALPLIDTTAAPAASEA